MKFKIIKSITILSAATICTSCSSNITNSTSYQSDDSSINENDSSVLIEDSTQIKFPENLSEIPSDYFSSCENQGQLVDLYYGTYESFSYENKTQPLRKHAVIYLPYNYDEKCEYNIFYLMHGGWGNEYQSLGSPSSPNSFKNVIDNAIDKGDIEPFIVVCPTYNNTSQQDSGDFSLAMRLTRNYHNELINDLIPAVEGKYSTYAKGSSLDELKASKSHRAFGGFSMGSVTTWRTFQYALDYFRYFIPMSCGTTLDDEEIWSAAKGKNQNEYFVMMMVGTSDFSYSYDTARANKMRQSEYFTEQTETNDGNFVFRTKSGYSHNGIAADEYVYNALSYIW